MKFYRWLIFCFALIVMSAASCSDEKTGGSAEDTPSTSQRLPESGSRAAELSFVQNQPARIREYLDRFPKELTDVDALGDSLKSPADAVSFVQNRIAIEPYAGIMKGASGALGTRGGNALDRALLLAALLKRQGISTTIVGGQLTEAQTKAVLDRIAAQPDAIVQLADSLPQPPAEKSPGSVEPDALNASAKARAQAQRIEADESLSSLRALLTSSGALLPPRSNAAAVARDHYWVRATLPHGTEDLDPTLPEKIAGRPAPDDSMAFSPDNPPEALHQHLAMRIVAETIAAGKVSAKDLLYADARTADLIGENIRVVIAPAQLARDQNNFIAQLTLGKAGAVSSAFELTETTGSGGSIADVFSGMDEAVDNEIRLARLAIEVTAGAPGGAAASYRRVIFDRLEREGSSERIRPDMTDDEGIRPMLVQAWDGAIDVGVMHPALIAEWKLKTLLVQQPMMTAALEASTDPSKPFGVEMLAPPSLSATLPEFFYVSGLSHAQIAMDGAPALREYHSRPRIAFMRNGVTIHDWSRPDVTRRYQRNLDILNAPYGYIGADRDAARLALEIGIKDATLERAYAAPSSDFSTIPLWSAAMRTGISFETVDSRRIDRVESLQLPSAVREVLRGEIGRGRTVVVPQSLVQLNDVRTVGWWSVDPDSAVPLGQMELGAGQGAVETSQLTRKVMEMNQVIMNFYGGMVGCYFAEASTQLFDPGAPYEISNLPFAPKAKTGRTLAQCVATNVCEAIVSYTMLAATSPSVAARAWPAIAELSEMLLQMYIAEQFTTIGCERL